MDDLIASSQSTVQVRYFAAAADVVGVEAEVVTLSDGADLDALLTLLVATHGAELARILEVSAFLVGGEITRDRGMPVTDRVDVLPPFAGG